MCSSYRESHSLKNAQIFLKPSELTFFANTFTLDAISHNIKKVHKHQLHNPVCYIKASFPKTSQSLGEATEGAKNFTFNKFCIIVESHRRVTTTKKPASAVTFNHLAKDFKSTAVPRGNLAKKPK